MTQNKTDDPIITARRQGAQIELLRVIAALRNYKVDVAKGIPAHVGHAFAQIVQGAIDHVTETGSENDRADAR